MPHLLETEAAAESTSKRIVRVLHVDGDTCFLKTTRQCLELHGNLHVDLSCSVEEAKEKMKQETFDVIVSDYQMNDKDCLEFLKELRAAGDMVPFIVLTGKTKEEVAVKALNLGAFRYIDKRGNLETVYDALASGIQQAFKQHQAEEAMRENEKLLLESRQKFRVLFSENLDAVVFCDKDFGIVDANASFNMLFEYTLDEVKSKDVLDLIVPEDLKDEEKSIRQSLQCGRFECSTVRKRKDGSQVKISLFGAPVMVNRSVTGYFMVYKDITGIVFAEEELNRMFEEQSKMLNKTTLLNEKLSVTGNLTRHDVQNKLAAITGYAYMAKKRLADNNELKSYLLQIEEGTKNIVKILDFAKSYELLGTQELEYVNVYKMVNEASSLFADLKGVTVLNECSGFEVLADSLLMELFHNLIDNSLKYGEKIKHIRVFTQKNQDGTTDLIYQDDGAGIEPTMKDRLFQKGFGKGTGYGLYLIKRICEMYGWTIQENGEYGKGVRFLMKIQSSILSSAKK